MAKTTRDALRTFIGGFNITTAVQDAINTTLDGLGRFFIRLGVLTSWEVNSIRQSSTDADTLEVDVTVGVPIPLNTIKLTLVV